MTRPPITSAPPRDLRLDLARGAGLVLPADGRILVMHPGPDDRFDSLPAVQVLIHTPHRPVADALARRGFATDTALPAQADAVILCLPRNREEGRDALARACALTRGPVVVDGQKEDGIDAMLRALRPLVALGEPIAKGHGKIAWFPSPGPAALADWRAGERRITDSAGRGFVTLPGVFSADGVDPGSALLAAALPAGMTGTGADLGAGWGYLSADLLARASAITALHLVEADSRALACARRNVTDPRAAFHWLDATGTLPLPPLDFVVMNPPFHRGRAGDPGLGAAFIGRAAACLKPGGALWLVANRHLPYEAALAAHFRTVAERPGADAGFKIMHAQAPRRETGAGAGRRKGRPG